MSRIIIIGGSGLLGINWAFRRRELDEVHITTYKKNVCLEGIKTHTLDASDFIALTNLLEFVEPDLIINCVGLTDIEVCENNSELSYKINVVVAENIAKFAGINKIPLIHISTDHLFSGLSQKSNELSKPSPQNTYAKHKLLAERIVRSNSKEALILRTTFFGWGPEYRESLSDRILNMLTSGLQVQMFDDVFFTPLDCSTLVDIAHELVAKIKGETINCSSGKRISKYEFSVKLAEAFGFDGTQIQPIQASRIQNNVKRPLDLSLNDDRLRNILGKVSINIDECIDKLKNQRETCKDLRRVGKLIPYGKHFLDQHDIAAVTKTLKSGSLTQGETIPVFEERIANYTGSKYAIAVSSATAGLHLAYKALGVRQNRSVLTSPITFVSTANASYFCGGFARFADINPNTINISLEQVKKSIDKYNDIHVVAPVLFMGSAEGIPEVCTYAKSKGKFVVEDAAHGLGGVYSCGSKIGSCRYSDCTVFSLHPVKSIAAGEGGVITTNDHSIYKSLLRLRSHGVNKADDKFLNAKQAFTDGQVNLWYYEMTSLGFHYRFTDIQASLALSQMNKLDDFVNKRRDIANRYSTWIKKQNNVAQASNVNINESANHIYVISADFDKMGISRNNLMSSLRSKNIITQVHYIPVVNQPFYAQQGINQNNFPKSQKYYENALSLPLYYSLSDDDFNYVIKTIEKFLQ